MHIHSGESNMVGVYALIDKGANVGVTNYSLAKMITLDVKSLPIEVINQQQF